MENTQDAEFFEVTGIMPPREAPTKFRLYRKRISPDTYYHWVLYWIKDFEIWAPCSSTVWEVNGCIRINRTEFDTGTDIFHKMVVEKSDEPYSLIIQVKDHCSFRDYAPSSSVLQEMDLFVRPVTETFSISQDLPNLTRSAIRAKKI